MWKARTMDAILREVKAEALRAQNRYGVFRSTHEALGVLMEEVAELMEAIRRNDLDAVASEATQVSAVAARLADCIQSDGPMRLRSMP